MNELFLGTGIAHSILLFALVIATGLYLGKFKIKGISIGSTWILFVGILFSHFGLLADPTVLTFMKDMGLILFVFSIGLQVGPGFFQSFKKGGILMNGLAVCLVLLAVAVTYVIHLVTGESLQTMTGVMSSAVTNTPGLGAAQQTLSDSILANGGTASEAAAASADLSSAYAVAYPIGVLGVIFALMFFKSAFRIDLEKEKAALEHDESDDNMARVMHCEVTNPAIFSRTIKEIANDLNSRCVISRIMRNGEISIPDQDTVLHQGDKVVVVTSQHDVDSIRIIFGNEVDMLMEDWVKMDEHVLTRKLIVTRSELTGKKLSDLNLRHTCGINVTRVMRSGIELVARPNLIIQMGDKLKVVGTETNIKAAAKVVGNRKEILSHPNLIPIFFGIAIGVIFGSIPITFPGIPQPIKLGLAGGPLIIAIIIGAFGTKWKITTYTTSSANMMIREMGISFFMAAVGLGAGQNFISSIAGGGYWWILYGALITIIPVSVIIMVARLAFKLNFYQICGLVSGGCTNPPVLAFSQAAYGTDYTSVNYATVYPLTMFMRVLVAQLLILISL